MANSSNAASLPAPDAGSNPQLNVAPEPSPRKRRVARHPFALTQAQRAEVELTLHLCTEGLKPEYAGPLNLNTVEPAFLTTLQTNAKEVQDTGLAAMNATNSKEACTAGEATAKAALMAKLRKIQSAARAAYGDTQPQRVHDYLVGNVIDANRPTLESASQSLITQADTDKPGDINTEFIAATTLTRAGYVTQGGAQESDIGRGKQKRIDRNAAIASIRARRMKVQRAADAAWPYTDPNNADVRTVFRLPANRPYSH